jgi:hypothetical protein
MILTLLRHQFPQVIQYSIHINYLPIALKGKDRFYAQAEKSGVFFGVWSTIETPDPAIREPVFSYASINIIDPG